MVDGLARRVALLESRVAIRELVMGYCMAIDDRDIDALEAMFCEDVLFGHADGSLEKHGRDEVVAFYRGSLSLLGPTYHYPHSQAITFDDAKNARGTVLAHAELARDGETIQVALRYKDCYRNEEGSWRFASRYLQIMYFMTLGELATGRLNEPLRNRYPGPDALATDLPESLSTWRRFYGLDTLDA